MKKLFKIVMVLLLIGSMFGCTKSGEGEGDTAKVDGCKTLNVYNASEYIGEDVLKNFEEEFGVKVNYSLFDSNEAMYIKLQSGAKYDVIIPSDYMIERLISEDMLQPIDKSIVTNLSNLYEGTLNKEYDPDNTYSVPYFWGNVGIVYDSTVVDQADVESQGWDVLRNTKYRGQIYMYDSQRDSFMMAFKALGFSMNTENEDEINQAYEWLLDIHKNMDPAYVTDEAIDGLIYGEKAMGMMYSGDAAYILSENENMRFYIPSQGTNYWTDAMVIPANSKCPELANEYINFILDYDQSYDNSITVGYASSNAEVFNELKDTEFEGNNAYAIPNMGPNDEVFRHNPVQVEKLSELWIKVIATKRD